MQTVVSVCTNSVVETGRGLLRLVSDNLSVGDTVAHGQVEFGLQVANTTVGAGCGQVDSPVATTGNGLTRADLVEGSGGEVDHGQEADQDGEDELHDGSGSCLFVCLVCGLVVPLFVFAGCGR